MSASVNATAEEGWYRGRSETAWREMWRTMDRTLKWMVSPARERIAA